MHENQICNYIKSLFVVLQQYPLLSFHFEEAMNENTKSGRFVSKCKSTVYELHSVLLHIMNLYCMMVIMNPSYS